MPRDRKARPATPPAAAAVPVSQVASLSGLSYSRDGQRIGFVLNDNKGRAHPFDVHYLGAVDIARHLLSTIGASEPLRNEDLRAPVQAAPVTRVTVATTKESGSLLVSVHLNGGGVLNLALTPETASEVSTMLEQMAVQLRRRGASRLS